MDLAATAERGIKAYLVFGVIERAKKDEQGSAALDGGNVVCELLRQAKAAKLPMVGITDLCFCEYTSHGHCGPMTADGATVKNDETVRNPSRTPMHRKAAATVCAVVFVAPATEPSALPSRTSIFPK